jgi:hypothetical protein
MQNSIVLIGSGNSIRQGDNQSSPQNLEVWNKLINIPTLSINWGYRFIQSTIAMYGDYQFYIAEKKQLDNHPLIIGKQDGYYKRKESVELGKNVTLLPTANVWYGQDSWKKGIYCSMLTGIAAVTLAYLLGFKRIFLLGADGCEIDGRTHFYQGEPNIGVTLTAMGEENTGIGKNKEGRYRTSPYNSEKELNDWYAPLLNIPTDVKIFNVSPQSKLYAFTKLNYDEFYAMIKDESSFNQDELRNEIRQYIKERT